MVNRSVTWANWDEELLSLELQDLSAADFDLSLTGFDPGEIDGLLAIPDEERGNAAPPLPENPISRVGDLWICGKHRVLCGDATRPEDIARLLGDRKPILMLTDPPYGIELDSEWRDRAGLNSAPGQKRTAATKAAAKTNPQYPAAPSYMKHRTEGHHETTSGDTRAVWSAAFELMPSLQVAYVWHASRFTREVLNGLLRIGFEHHQQIIWDKGRTVLTRTLYWFQHEPCWFVRKKNAPWFGKAGENSTIWASPSPKFIMRESDEEKYDHPTQKPVDLMRRPILNHLRRGELVYDPFLGSGTTLAAAELTERVCVGMELDLKYVDVIVQRWQIGGGVVAPAKRGSHARRSAEIANIAPQLAHVRAGHRAWRWLTARPHSPQTRKARLGCAGRAEGGSLMLLGIDAVAALPALGLEGFDRVAGLLHRSRREPANSVLEPAHPALQSKRSAGIEILTSPSPATCQSRNKRKLRALLVPMKSFFGYGPPVRTFNSRPPYPVPECLARVKQTCQSGKLFTR
jgi:DNA modification methylase